jgi:tetratricopeptide (TPR) repeat protein
MPRGGPQAASHAQELKGSSMTRFPTKNNSLALHTLPWLALPSLVSLSACKATTHDTTAEANAAYLYDDLGTHHREIVTSSPIAQRYFDQGLVLTFAFNHDEAMRSYRQAAQLDPTCAMAWWGVALVNGPHINNATVDAAHARVAWDALGRARTLSRGASKVEQALIEAVGHRYSADFTADRGPLDRAYADAMRGVWHENMRDADIGTLFAESLMDLHPWDLWTHSGEPKEDTPEILETLERVLSFAPDHPGACHLYIHAMEASRTPEKAAPAADRLRSLVPGAGHLVHMPAHIDLRLGHYTDASAANVRAIAADQKHRGLFPAAGFYRVYMAHNYHFLTFASMMEGRSEAALAAAQNLVNGVPKEFIENSGPLIDGFMPTVLHTQVRFGLWQDVLRQPEFAPHLTASTAMRHYSRGIAYAALGQISEAEREQTEFLAALKKVDDRSIGNNPARTVLGIAKNMLAGEIAFRRGEHDAGIALLREAAQAEDTLVYDEPPDWMMPVRHALGAALMEAKQFQDAERVYREDLARFPDNGWSLFGLARCLREQNLQDEARAIDMRFEKAWSRADVKLKSSCFCQPGL